MQTVGQYLGKTKGPVINQHAVTDDYRAKYGETFVPGPGDVVTNAYAYEHALPDETVSEARARLEAALKTQARYKTENRRSARWEMDRVRDRILIERDERAEKLRVRYHCVGEIDNQ